MSSDRGTLSIRIGPVQSGKTSWLDSELSQLSNKGSRAIKIVYSSDKEDEQYKNILGSRNKIRCVFVSNLKDVKVSEYQVIGIDDGQFFPDLYEVIKDWIENKKHNVKVCSLDGDSNRQKFGQILDLIPLSDECVKFRAKCKYCCDHLKSIGICSSLFATGYEGPFTKRIETEESRKYVAVCGNHHC